MNQYDIRHIEEETPINNSDRLPIRVMTSDNTEWESVRLSGYPRVQVFFREWLKSDTELRIQEAKLEHHLEMQKLELEEKKFYFTQKKEDHRFISFRKWSLLVIGLLLVPLGLFLKILSGDNSWMYCVFVGMAFLGISAVSLSIFHKVSS